MLIQAQVQQSLPVVRTSGQPNLNLDQLGNLAVSEVQPRYAALGWSGQVYTASHSAAQALSVASTTFTGLAIGNPTGSGKNLVIIDASVALAAVITTGFGVPRLGYAATVALTQGNATSSKGLPVLVGSGGSSVATVGASATLTAAPTTLRPMGSWYWVTGGTGLTFAYAKDEVGGAIIIPPGQMLTIDALVAAGTVIASVTWAEVAI